MCGLYLIAIEKEEDCPCRQTWQSTTAPYGEIFTCRIIAKRKGVNPSIVETLCHGLGAGKCPLKPCPVSPEQRESSKLLKGMNLYQDGRVEEDGRL
jgi:hypothetical protein